MKKTGISFLLAAALVATSLPVGSRASAALPSGGGKLFSPSDKGTVSSVPSGSQLKTAAGGLGGNFGGTENGGADGEATPDTHWWTLQDGVLTVGTLEGVDAGKLPEARQKNPGAIPDYTDDQNSETKLRGDREDGYRHTPWWQYRDSIQKIVITGDVTKIGTYAFGIDYYDDPENMYSALREVDLTGAEKLTEIGEGAFAASREYEGELALQSVKGIGRIKKIGKQAFCFTDLSEPLELEELTSIGVGAFDNCSELPAVSAPKLIDASDSNNIFDSCEKLKEVSMPNLQAAGTSMFLNTGIESIDLPELTQPGGSMFRGCSQLKDVKLDKVPWSVNEMFMDCSSLETITLPLCANLSNRMFDGCRSLYEVNMPNLQMIGSNLMYVFSDCWQMKSLDSLHLGEREGWTSTANHAGLLCYLPNMVWTELPAAAARSMFNGSNTKLFESDYSLKRIYLHGMLDNAAKTENFSYGEEGDVPVTGYVSGCTIYAVKSGKDEKQPVNNSSDDSPDWSVEEGSNSTDDTEDYLHAFTEISPDNKVVLVDSEEELKALTAKENEIRISQEDYYNTDKAKQPSVVYNKAGDAAGEIKYFYYKQIKNGTSYAAWQLVDEEHPNDPPTEIGDYWVRAETEDTENWFGTTSNYAPFRVEGETLSEDGKWGYHGGTHTLTVYDRTILEQGFSSADEVPWKEHEKEIVAVSVSDSVNGSEPLDKVGAYAFYGLENVETLPVANTVEAGDCAWKGCFKWKRSGTLTVKSIGAEAFRDCRALTGEIVLQDGVTKVPEYAFYSCKAKKITVPDSVKEFERYCFADCANLTEIHVPDGVKAFGEYCFANCVSLTAIHIPDGVESLPVGFLSGDLLIAQADIPDSVVQIQDKAFQDTALASVRLPKKLGSRFVSLDAESDDPLANQLPIGDFVFAGCGSLERIEIPESLTILSGQTFESCTGLKEITIPKTVKEIAGTSNTAEIAGGLFGRCYALERVVFDNTEYTEKTLRKTGHERKADVAGTPEDVCVDAMFFGTPETLKVICDGTTYDVLKEYAQSRSYDEAAGWTSADVLYRPSDFAEGWKEDLKAVQGMEEKSYSEQAWKGMQNAVARAQKMIEEAAVKGPGEQADAYLDAADLLRQEAKQIFGDTYQKTTDIQRSQYYDRQDADSIKAWNEYEEALEKVQETVDETELLKAGRYLDDEAYLKGYIDALEELLSRALKALDSALAQAADLDSAEYSEESWNALQEAVTGAQAAKEKNSKYEMRTAKETLQKALAALEKIAPGSTTSAEPGTDATAAPDDTKEPGTDTSAAPDGTAAPGVDTSAAPDGTKEPGADTSAMPDDTKEPGTDTTTAPNDTKEPGADTSAAPDGTAAPGVDTSAAPGGTKEPGADTSAAPDSTAAPGTDTSAAPNSTASTAPDSTPGTQASDTPSGTEKKSDKKEKVTVKKAVIKKAESKKKKTMTVQWKKLSGVSGYQIVIGLDKKMKKGRKTVNIKKAKTLKTMIKKLKSKKKYFVKVRAYKTVKGKKYYGSWSKVKAVKVK